MRFSKPQTTERLRYTSLHINTCSDVSVIFDLLSGAPQVAARRYCNKILVHECVTAVDEAPLDLTNVEFFATSDPCYGLFEFYKQSTEQNGEPATIVLHENEDELVTNIEVTFTKEELCCKPLRMSYRLYGTIAATEDEPEERLLLSNGVLYLTPCQCCGGCSNVTWTEVDW